MESPAKFFALIQANLPSILEPSKVKLSTSSM